MLTQTLPRTIRHPRPGWGLWAAWTLATVYGAVAGLLILFGIPVPLPSDGTIGIIYWGIVIALMTSLAQWPILHRYLPTLNPRQWVGATVLGATLGFFVGWACESAADALLVTTIWPHWDTHTLRDPITLAVGGAGTGIILALAQWQALRLYLRGAARWIVVGAAACAWAGAAAVIMHIRLWEPLMMMNERYVKTDLTFVQTLSRATGLPEIIIFALLLGVGGGLLLGAITGLALVALVRARTAETE